MAYYPMLRLPLGNDPSYTIHFVRFAMFIILTNLLYLKKCFFRRKKLHGGENAVHTYGT